VAAMAAWGRKRVAKQAATRDSAFGHLDEGRPLPPLVRMVPRSAPPPMALRSAPLNAATDLTRVVFDPASFKANQA
jgi:hypothetical protein